jgi:hypothetical protein
VGSLCGCDTTVPNRKYQAEESHVIKDVRPRVVQPDLAKWRNLKVGMTEAEVTTLLGKPYRKDLRPPAATDPSVIHLYRWDYGEITFNTFNTNGTFSYSVSWHEGRVYEISNPWAGTFSPGGSPRTPGLVLPQAGKKLDHYPRFLDFRWQPSSGIYPIEYQVVIQTLGCDQHDAEHLKDYVGEQVKSNRESWKAECKSAKEMDELAAF